MKLSATSRRKVLGDGGGYFLSSLLPDSRQRAETDTGEQGGKEDLLADLPMVRLRLPKAALGREYVALQLFIRGKGPFDFMVDTGLTTEMITPHLVQSLGLAQGNNKVRGLGAGGNTFSSLVTIEGASVCGGKVANKDQVELSLPPLTAVVTDFPQEHIDPSHDPVEGMLGMEALSLFDLDLDFPAGRIRLWKPGTAGKQLAIRKGMVEIPAVVINESGLYGIRVTTASDKQPVLGIIDCGSTFSALNWAAAAYLGLPPKGDTKAYGNTAAIAAIGIDGKPILMPTRNTRLTFAGNAQTNPSTGALSFEEPPNTWKPWDRVQLAIGDLPVFRDLLGDEKRPYEGPACLVGLDILAQRRVIVETGKSRQRRLWVG